MSHAVAAKDVRSGDWVKIGRTHYEIVSVRLVEGMPWRVRLGVVFHGERPWDYPDELSFAAIEPIVVMSRRHDR